MSRVVWDQQGKKFFETGTDRGVLYLPNGPGIPWNGLTAITDTYEGGEAEAFYLDGVKILNEVSGVDKKLKLSAYTYPDEFDECVGVKRARAGVYATGQSHIEFDLCYRTLVGNDTQGDRYGYRLNFLYNCTALPFERKYETRGDVSNPSMFEWEIHTRPKPLVGFLPTAHYYVNSFEVPERSLQKIESIVYGSNGCPSRMIQPAEILTYIPDWVCT